MEARNSNPAPFFVLDSMVDPARLTIRKGDAEEARVRPRSMAVLTTLAAAKGQVVSKNELMAAVWPRVEVTEGVLSQAMVELRNAFADDSKDPRYIETIRSVGFRLIPPVRRHGMEPVIVSHPAISSTSTEASSKEQSRGQSRRIWVLGILAVSAAVIALTYQMLMIDSGTPEPQLPFVMIAPFEVLSSEGEQGYFARGFAEAVALHLSSNDRLRLFSNQALRLLVKQGEQPVEIASRFGVDYILTGSIDRQQDQLRVVAELVDASSGEQRWVSTYQRPPDLVLVLEEEIAAAIAGVLVQEGQISRHGTRTTNLAAYDYYLRGRDFVALHQYGTNEQAIRLFRDALAIDPEFASARASLSEALTYRGYVYQRGNDTLEQAISEADRALSTNPALAQALYAKAGALSGLGRFTEATEVAEQSLRASPNYSDAAFTLGYLADVRGDLAAAVAYYQRALEVDPTQPRTVALARLLYLASREEEALQIGARGDRMAPGVPTLYLAFLLTLMERQDRANRLCEQLLQMDIPRVRNLCGFAALVAGNMTTAERLYEEDWQLDPRGQFGPFSFAPSATHLAWIKSQADRPEEAMTLLAESERVTRELLEQRNEHWALNYNLAAIASMRDQQDLALELLDSAYEKGFRDYRLLELDPVFGVIRTEPGFLSLVRSIKRDFADLGA